MEEGKFDAPRYSGQAIKFENEGIGGTIGSGADMLKTHAKAIIAVIILLIVAWFAYDYFIGSMREVTIVIKNTEGEQLSTNRIKLSDESGNEIATLSEDSSYTEQLKAGTYRFEASVPGYETESGSFKLSTSGELQEIIVEKGIDIEILDFKDVFPSEWIEGQSRTVEFQVKNNGNSSESAEIVFEDGIESTPSKQVVVAAKNV